MSIAEEMAQESAKATVEIEKVYNRAVNTCLQTLSKAIVEAQTYTRPSNINEAQQGYIARLRKLEDAMHEMSKNPLGEFNWDWMP